MDSLAPPDVTVPGTTIRKPRLKLNSELLLSDRGFRYLRTHANQLQFKGSGHEVEDLDALMLFYREWSHYLFPEAKFTDFCTKVRKECSSKLMKQYMHELRYRAVTSEEVDEFAEIDAGLEDIKELVNEKQAQLPEDVDFEGFDFEDEDEKVSGGDFSEDERILRELEDCNS